MKRWHWVIKNGNLRANLEGRHRQGWKQTLRRGAGFSKSQPSSCLHEYALWYVVRSQSSLPEVIHSGVSIWVRLRLSYCTRTSFNNVLLVPLNITVPNINGLFCVGGETKVCLWRTDAETPSSQVNLEFPWGWHCLRLSIPRLQLNKGTVTHFQARFPQSLPTTILKYLNIPRIPPGDFIARSLRQQWPLCHQSRIALSSRRCALFSNLTLFRTVYDDKRFERPVWVQTVHRWLFYRASNVWTQNGGLMVLITVGVLLQNRH